MKLVTFPSLAADWSCCRASGRATRRGGPVSLAFCEKDW